MDWAIAYSATVLALAYAIPRGLAIWAQLSLMRNQMESFETATSPSGEAKWPEGSSMFDGGGYA